MEVVRRFSNYKPSLWTHTYLNSLTSIYGENIYKERAEKLKGNIKIMLKEANGTLNQLELIDNIQRLGVCYHFEDETDEILKGIFVNFNSTKNKRSENISLYAASLQFRLLRQHGYLVLPQDAFKDFIDDGTFKTKPSDDTTKGILNLYEASFLAIQGENILDVAQDFAIKYLNENLELTTADDPTLGEHIRHALELPFHWRMPRVEVRWYIPIYQSTLHMNPVLLEFAKLDFNIVQALYIEEIKDLSRWNTSTKLTEKMSFARDRIVECYFWMLGLTFELQFGYTREIITKLGFFVNVIDDAYDTYATLDEVRLFTQAIERWDVKEIEQLPSYMRVCFLVVFNLINELVFNALKEQDIDIGPPLRKALLDYCKSGEVEAKWYHSGYKPALDEYLECSLITVSTPFLIICAYFITASPITKQAIQSLDQYPSIVRWSNMVVRLADDLATSYDEIKRGDVPKLIQCYMHEKGASEEEARAHVNHLISESWKKINNNLYVESPFSKTYIPIAMNLARVSQCVYQTCDGNGYPTPESKEQVASLLVHPIPI
uniref:Sesquiterpene synthase 2 n=1 Tax=Valeriana officinalis TaxID=19953 RepID=L0HLG9_VALOF|nr:sesquiterpene synthase 2 [Valeriana officinalis]